MFEQFVNLWAQDAQFPWFVLTIIAIFISFSLSAIAYMLSKLFESESLFKWSKTEFLYALSTTFILLLIFTIFISLDKLMVGFALQASESQPAVYAQVKAYSKDNPHALLALYLDRISTCAREEYVWIGCLSVIPMTLSKSSVGDKAAQGKDNADFIVASTEKVTMNLLNSAMYQITYAVYSSYVQKHLLLFVQQTMLTLFLPLGILLRTFPFTRGAGNMFIALAIGFYVVYPTAYAMTLVISMPLNSLETACGIAKTTSSFSDYAHSCGAAIAEGSTYLVSGATSAGLQGVYKRGIDAFGKDTLLGRASGMLSMTSSTFVRYSAASVSAGTFLYLLYDEVTRVFSSLLVYVLLFPLVMLGITLTFIKFFADFLGAGVEDFANGLLRMV